MFVTAFHPSSLLLQALEQIAHLSSLPLSEILKIWREIKATRIAALAAKDCVTLTQELASLAASSNADPAACLPILSKANCARASTTHLTSNSRLLYAARADVLQ